jgi:hypothetical protein
MDNEATKYHTHTLGDMLFTVFAPSVHIRNEHDVVSTYLCPTGIGM